MPRSNVVTAGVVTMSVSSGWHPPMPSKAGRPSDVISSSSSSSLLLKERGDEGGAMNNRDDEEVGGGVGPVNVRSTVSSGEHT